MMSYKLILLIIIAFRSGSVSKLASLLDTDVVAARHDQQTYRQNPGASVYSAQEDNARAILEQTSSLGVPSYVVRIPYY